MNKPKRSSVNLMSAIELRSYIEYLDKRIAELSTEKVLYEVFLENCEELGFDVE